MAVESDSQEHAGLGAAEFSVVRTELPWNLDIDAIVLSVGSTLGDLAYAVKEVFPSAPWDGIQFEDITPGRPGLLDLAGSSVTSSRLTTAVLVTAHQGGMNGLPTLETIGAAVGAAVRRAAQARATALGVPLVGAGALHFDPVDVARVVVPATVAAFDEVRGGTLRRIVFFDKERDGESALQAALSGKDYDGESAIQAALSGPSTPAMPITQPGYSTDELAGGVCTDRVDPNVGIPLTRDQLGVAPYVSMLATVIADRKTSLPVSVGVFGEWGSGKSYFMGLLRQQIDDLAGSSASYCDEIVQIGFNAWHYADSNLWACLGDEIFRQLAGPGPGHAERRERIRAELGERLEQLRELKATTERAQTTVATLQSSIDSANAARRTTARDLVVALRKSDALGEKLDELWSRLGISDADEQGALLAEQLQGSLTEAEALRRSPRDRWGRAALAVSAVILVVGVLVSALVPAAWEWLVGVWAVFTAVAGVSLTVVRRARGAIGTLREVGEDLRTNLDEAARDRVTPEVRELLAALRKAEAEQRVAEAQLNEVVARVGELGRQLTELTPGNRLYTFLAERARSDSYRSNLGLISTIRKDFEHLVELMRDWRLHGEQAGSDRTPIDRIVLYIDDLDRCSARQVVDVLQAVHLLLAMDLFVVVIGVDPRWLLNSLRSHYDPILDDTHERCASPEDYLEKIINIPFALPGMSSGKLRGLLRSIIEETETETRTASTGDTSLEPEPPRSGYVNDSGSIAIEAGSEVGGQRDPARQVRSPRPLTEPEIELLAALEVLITTPRQAKRLFNLYRMLRATRDLSEASRFLGADERPGEYQAVALLLGLLTADARRFGALLDASPGPTSEVRGGLLHRDPESRWGEFVADIEPRAVDEGRWTNGIVGTLPEDESGDWKRLHRGLVSASSSVTLTDLSALRSWAPVIRRFSYVPSTGSGSSNLTRGDGAAR